MVAFIVAIVLHLYNTFIRIPRDLVVEIQYLSIQAHNVSIHIINKAVLHRQGYNQWQQPPPNQPYGAPPPRKFSDQTVVAFTIWTFAKLFTEQGGWNQSAPPPQQGWNAPHGGQQPQYPPSNQQYPPQQGYGAPPPQFNQQYPPSAPQGQYGAPQQGYGAPPPQFNQQQPPYNQQQQYGQQPPYGQQQPQYPQQGYQAPAGGYGQPTGPPAPPSPGYAPGTHINYDASRDVDAIKKACKGFGTDEKALIAALVKLDPLQIEAVNARFAQGERKPLIKLIDDETSGAFQEGLIMIARGPLHLDTWLLYRATKGAGTKEVYLNDAPPGTTERRYTSDQNGLPKRSMEYRLNKYLERIFLGKMSVYSIWH